MILNENASINVNGLGSDTSKLANLKNVLQGAIFGQEELVEEVLCCLLASGHALITGAPGLAKTTLVKLLSSTLNLQYKRVQFTPDVLPSDILGSQILEVDPESGKRFFSFQKGPVFTNFLLADEINRASPKTQSALLEAMGEGRSTIAGDSQSLPHPFMVFATQNPLESEGTFVLPEAQLDRFLVHIHVGYPKFEDELKILTSHSDNSLIGLGGISSNVILEKQDLLKCQEEVKQLSLSKELLEACLTMVRMTRPSEKEAMEEIKPLILFGGGPRAGLSLITMAKAYAYLSGDEEVRWRHIHRMAKPVLRHRIKLSSTAIIEQVTEDEIIEKILERLKASYLSA